MHPSQGITYMTDGKDSVSVYSRGLYEVEVTDDAQRAVALTLFRSPANETWEVSPNETALIKELNFEYSFSAVGQNETEALQEGETWRSALKALHFKPSCQGNLPAEFKFIEDTAKTAVLSFAKLNENGEFEVRYYNISDAEKFKLTLPVNVEEAVYTDFNGKRLASAYFKDNVVEIEIGTHKIATVAIKFVK